jgi:hypothetical protein
MYISRLFVFLCGFPGVLRGMFLYSGLWSRTLTPGRFRPRLVGLNRGWHWRRCAGFFHVIK